MANSLNAATSTNTTQESELTLLNASSAAWDSNAVTVKASSGAWTTASTATGRVIQVEEVVWQLDNTPAVTFASDGAHGVSAWVHAFSGAFTPTSSSSKVLVQATIQVYGADTGGNWDAPQVHGNVHRLNADGSTAVSLISGVGGDSGWWIYQRENEPIPSYVGGPITITRLDSPGTTNAVVYNVVVKCAGNWTTCYMYGGAMILQEISG